MCDVVCSTGLDKYVMTCIHNFSIIYSRFIALKILCALPIHLSLPPPLAITDFLIVSMVFAFSRISSSWNHAVHSHFRLAFSTMHLSFFTSFHSLMDHFFFFFLINHFFLALIVYCLDVPEFIYPFTVRRTL